MDRSRNTWLCGSFSNPTRRRIRTAALAGSLGCLILFGACLPACCAAAAEPAAQQLSAAAGSQPSAAAGRQLSAALGSQPSAVAGSQLIAPAASQLSAAAGRPQGLVVVLGCAEAELAAELGRHEDCLVQVLDADAAKVASLRRSLQSEGCYGRVSARVFDGRHLPYVDNLVNLLVIGEAFELPREEMLRVVAPLGRLCTKPGEPWTVTTKRWPAEIDEWTHFLHGPDNNAVGHDRRAGVPRSIQWVAGPRWGRSHEELASLSAAATAGGRIYYIIDEGPLASIRYPADWHLVARDAFNGTLLWKRPLGRWVDHLRHFRSGPAHLPRRLVAEGDRVYATLDLAGPVVALDGATGRLLREYEGTQYTEEIVFAEGVLYLAVGTSEAERLGGGLFARGEPEPAPFRRLMAVEAESGKLRWQRDYSAEFILPLTLAVRGGRVYCQTTAGIVCLDAGSGEQRWLAARPTPQRRMSFSAPTLVATDEVVLCADRDTTEEIPPAEGRIEWGVHGWNEPGFARNTTSTLRAYKADDGKELWSVPCRENYNSPVDVLVIGETVYAGPGFQALDLKSGQPQQQLATRGAAVGMTHHRCYRDKATERFIFTGWSGIELVSLETGWLCNNSWLRGTCQYGIIPANGLVYAPPDACACFLTVKAPGFFAAATQRDATLAMPFPERPVVEKGPLYGKLLEAEAAADPGESQAAADRRETQAGDPGETQAAANAGETQAAANFGETQMAADPGETQAAADPADWPAFRHDALRSGMAGCELPERVAPRWSVTLGGRLTQPVAVGERVFVAAIDAHTLYALDAGSGRKLWSFTADGRIDSPPTVYRGRVLFGSADGWVYCVAAENGQLVWRFRAAPAERFVCAYEQLESIWPVHGAVLVQNDTVYASAGRSSYLDGGIVLYRLDPQTGRPLSRTVLHHLHPRTGRQLVAEANFNMPGTTHDVLTGDGERVYLKYFAFDASGQLTDESRPHLFSITSLLGEEWFVRTYWVLGEGMPGAGWGGWANAAKQFPFGRILCFDEEKVFGYGRQLVQAAATGHRADDYHLFCMKRSPAAPGNRASESQPRLDRRGQPAKGSPPAKGPLVWSDPQSLIVRAMVAGQKRLAVAGVPDLGRKKTGILAYENPEEALAAFQGQKGAFLRVVAAEDGHLISECELPAMPVFDGLCCARGRLLISLKNGAVLCLE